MIAPVSFTLWGHPQGKGRARAVLRGGHIGHYTPEKTRSYEGMMRQVAAEAMGNREPIAEPVEVVIRCVFDVPASWSEKKRAAAIAGQIKPAKKPDLDNIAKAVTDACNAVVFKDDALIVGCAMSKTYGPRPLVSVEVRTAA